MSHPPNYPGRDRLKRATARAGSDAYQGAFEAVGAILIACGFGWFIDDRWQTAPWGLVTGAVIGFAAMVLRLLRLGRELHPEGATAGVEEKEAEEVRLDRSSDDGPGTGVALGMSDALHEDASGSTGVVAEADANEDDRRE